MNKHWTWEKAAKVCQEKYGVFVSFDEGDEWFECPECGEPILKEDWEDENFIHCPVCGYNFDTDEYDSPKEDIFDHDWLDDDDETDWEDEIYNCD